MKKNIITGSVVLGVALSFSACAYKQECGVDGCGHPYTDTTYRIYTPKMQSFNTMQTKLPKNTPVLSYTKPLTISVVGEGVAPCNGICSPALGLALAKRAAVADAYRLIAEKVKGVYVEGNDYIKNMMVKNTTVRTYVSACLRDTNIVKTTYKNGLCQVEMEIKLKYADIVR